MMFILDNTSTHWLLSWFLKIDIEAFLNVHLGLLEDEAPDIGTTSLLVLKVGNCLYMVEDAVDGVYYYSDNRSFGLQSIDLLLLHLQDANTWKKGFMFIDHSSANSAWEPTWICWRIHCEFGAHRWMSRWTDQISHNESLMAEIVSSVNCQVFGSCHRMSPGWNFFLTWGLDQDEGDSDTSSAFCGLMWQWQ